jgi:hypothetical protein
MESADEQDHPTQFGRPVGEKEKKDMLHSDFITFTNSLPKPTISSRNTSFGKLQRSQNERRNTFLEPVCMFRRGNVTKTKKFSLTFSSIGS